MGSEIRESVRRQTRVHDRFGAVLTASMSVLFVEATICLIAFFVWGETQERPGLAYNAMGLFLLVMVAPVVAAVGAVFGALLSTGVVMPLLTSAAWFGRRFSGSEVWWWVPALAGVGLNAGIGYEPPRLSTERIVGTWSDGRGGSLTLTADGGATATRVRTFDVQAASAEPEVRTCTAAGTWEYDPGAGPWSQEVDVSVAGCSLDTWKVFGTPEHPKLFVFIGDPDSWDLYVLRRRD